MKAIAKMTMGKRPAEDEEVTLVQPVRELEDGFIKPVFDLSLLPCDVGFDLRVHREIKVTLPEVDSLQVRYMHRSESRVMLCTPAEAKEVLEKVGYTVA